MGKLFGDMTFTERLDHIQTCCKDGVECIQNRGGSDRAEVADMFDYWVPWMLKELKKRDFVSSELHRIRDHAKIIDNFAIELKADRALEALCGEYRDG